MKELIISLIVAISAFACTSNSEEDKSNAEGSMVAATTELDTTVVYWQIDLDTLNSDSSIQIGNEYYELEIATYSLNDSSISWVNDLSKDVIYLDIYHNRETNISLIRQGDTILESIITKSEFEHLFDEEFYSRCQIRNIEFDFVRSNRVYFNVTLSVPDTDWYEEAAMAIFYRTTKKGQVDYWGLKEEIEE
ncbi:MAG: DUF4738 domain-containing protein [Oceanospirillaceae bacterium]|nr:DUF4738 domain-containing protein [Oceanospirillaceae bacterium]